ncbi:putative rRNA methylase [Salsuginibacillus halophilus]|uniref:Putative rRNA methylase n=1 Tax=Salsuginibacillus halophilus TaxID=517424 RepID=A0A2P8HE62_9BACI|nr:class I SAM-dependent methyltransferase [Salsuginibacillus halophilus]PSL44510.1 putative rRNA methylase [Salsuginibacillus halophilus]
MTLYQILPFVRHLLSQHLLSGDTALDATAGKGHDTVFLADLVKPKGRVHSFDVQEAAIEATRKRAVDHEVLENIELHAVSHADMVRKLGPTELTKVRAAVFNLGYMPGSDKSIVTSSDSTIAALKQLLAHTKKETLILIVVYHGHPEGALERDELLNYVENLHQEEVHVARYGYINQRNNPPFLLALQKR